MEDYKANSHKSKAERESKEEKKITPVVKGKATKKKQSVARKFTDTFVSEDVHNVKSYVIMDVLIPAAKKAISDIVTNGIDMILYGETGRTKKRSSSGYISYNKYSEKDRTYDRRDDRTRYGYSYDDIVLETRSEAMEVLERMDEIIDTYGHVTVADMYDLVDVSSNYTDNKYGWTNLRDAEPVRVRDGYIIKLPKAKPIN